jgi:2-haloacid dehalogenase
MSHIKEFNIKKTLIIGDSLNTDIKGGHLSGIDTCWINSMLQKSSAEIKSTYTITSLAELYEILQPNKTNIIGDYDNSEFIKNRRSMHE